MSIQMYFPQMPAPIWPVFQEASPKELRLNGVAQTSCCAFHSEEGPCMMVVRVYNHHETPTIGQFIINVTAIITHPCSPHPLALPCLLLPAPPTSPSFPLTYQYCRSHPRSFVCHLQGSPGLTTVVLFILVSCLSPELPEPRSALCCPPNWSGI